jgi:holo-[acyl-carrier protein] synthase
MERVREFVRRRRGVATRERLFWGAARIAWRAYREVGGHGNFWRRSASCQYNRKRIRVQARRSWLILSNRRKTAGLKARLYKFFRSRSERDRMIVGMGIDVEEVERVRGAMERQGERFLRRIFTETERAYCEQFKDKYERYAGRFAVKEAAMKALGTGWSRGVRWVDIEITRLRGRRPTLELKGEARKIADRLGVKNIAISITHTSKQAMAQVIFES